jgi:uncharacterized protein (DUF486 family)
MTHNPAVPAMPSLSSLLASPRLTPILLLIGSNVFMTLAWYGHLRFKEAPLLGVMVASWLIAFLECCMAVPASRFGSAVDTTAPLKTIQEVITLVVFAVGGEAKRAHRFRSCGGETWARREALAFANPTLAGHHPSTIHAACGERRATPGTFESPSRHLGPPHGTPRPGAVARATGPTYSKVEPPSPRMPPPCRRSRISTA